MHSSNPNGLPPQNAALVLQHRGRKCHPFTPCKKSTKFIRNLNFCLLCSFTGKKKRNEDLYYRVEILDRDKIISLQKVSRGSLMSGSFRS